MRMRERRLVAFNSMAMVFVMFMVLAGESVVDIIYNFIK